VDKDMSKIQLAKSFSKKKPVIMYEIILGKGRGRASSDASMG
jgi:hypothetical protein